MITKGLSNVSPGMRILGRQSQYSSTASGNRKKFDLWELGFEFSALGKEPLPMSPSC